MPASLKTSKSREALFRLGVLLIVFLGSAFLSLVCSNRDNEIPREFRVLSLRELYPRALEAARQWKEDAYFNGADFWVAPKDDEHPLRAFFGFESENDQKWLIIEFCETAQGVEITSTKSGEYPFYVDKPSIDLDDVVYDSPEAFRKMFWEEGERLFRQHPEMIYPIELSLTHYEGSGVMWVTLFKPTGSAYWRISMDAISNEILEVAVTGVD